MIQVYADAALAYDGRLEEYALIKLTATSGTGIGGMAEITMPPGHPAYNLFIGHRTIVTIYRDGHLRFRGRALYPSDDFYGRRTITCEGEQCLLRDAISRPYLYTEDPAGIFTKVVQAYNDQMDAFKRFKLGVCTVTDPNDYIRLESQTAETVLDTLNKMVERVGGHLLFDDDPSDGSRRIHWVETAWTDSQQEIEFGENLLDFASTGANTTSLATGLIPYGRKYSDGTRLTIEEVNDGKDYIIDEEARALRGTIMATAVWDDVQWPENLLTKARAYLDEIKVFITSLELTALDLSYLDKSLDSFKVGDRIRVISKPHGVDDYFQLSKITEDFLDPSKSKIVLGREVRSLTGSDVAGDNAAGVQITEGVKEAQQAAANMEENLMTRVEQSEETIRQEVSATYARKDALEAVELNLSTQIQQTSDAILLEVSQDYATNDQLAEAITTRMTQLQDQFLFEFETLKAVVDENDATVQGAFTEIYNYISFEDGAIKLGGSDSAITLTIENDMIVFRKNGERFGWWDGVDFHTGNIVVEVNERAQFGEFAFVPRSNGSLSFLKVGG